MLPSDQPESGPHKYRLDIDGLRGLAILLVLFGHYFPEFMPHGYLGVDVFFVISGFVITNKLLEDKLYLGLRSLLVFFAARIRRLLPALITTTTISFVLIEICMTRIDGRVIRTGALSYIGMSNNYLIRMLSDYFGTPAVQNPFTHTWSLGIEEQFYFIFPILFFLLFRISGKLSTKILTSAFLTITLVSFFMNFLLQGNSSLVYYSLLTRAWELSLGVLLAILIFGNRYHLALHVRIIPILLIFVVLLCVLFNIDIIWRQLIVVVLACILLTPNYGSRFLTNRFSTWTGKRSYSLYLIHWPLLVISDYLFGVGEIKNLLLLPLLIVSAELLFRFVEQPFRVGRFRTSSPRTFLIGVVTAFSLSASVFFLAPNLAKSDNNLIPNLLGIERVKPWHPLFCPINNIVVDVSLSVADCLGSSNSGNVINIYSLGDSHSNQLQKTLSFAAKKLNYSFKIYNPSNVDLFPFTLFNKNWKDPALEFIISHASRGDLLVLTFHQGYLNLERDVHIPLSQQVKWNKQSHYLLQNLNQIATSLEHRGVRVILVRGTPLMGSIQSSESCALQLKILDRSGCRTTLVQNLHTRSLQDRVFSAIESKHSNVETWDPLPLIFPKEQYLEVLDQKGDYVMFDWNHISEATSERLGPFFANFVRNLKPLRLHPGS